jgi:hypothetical protein
MNLIKDLLARWYDSNVQTICELLFIPICFAEIWLMLMLMLICCERKILFIY